MKSANRLASLGFAGICARAAVSLMILSSVCLVFCSRSDDDNEDSVNLEECYEIADLYWSEDEYVQWLIDQYGITSDTEYWMEGNEEVCFPHHLPETKTDEYYQMIGKYEQFSHGWVDYDTLTGISQYRQSYSECLRDAGIFSKSLPTMPQ